MSTRRTLIDFYLWINCILDNVSWLQSHLICLWVQMSEVLAPSSFSVLTIYIICIWSYFRPTRAQICWQNKPLSNKSLLWSPQNIPGLIFRLFNCCMASQCYFVQMIVFCFKIDFFQLFNGDIKTQTFRPQIKQDCRLRSCSELSFYCLIKTRSDQMFAVSTFGPEWPACKVHVVVLFFPHRLGVTLSFCRLAFRFVSDPLLWHFCLFHPFSALCLAGPRGSSPAFSLTCHIFMLILGGNP